jgi:hypothetical protein
MRYAGNLGNMPLGLGEVSMSLEEQDRRLQNRLRKDTHLCGR